MKTLQIKAATALCLLMLFMGFIIRAQDVKPSKQETIEYIENYFKADYFTNGESFKSISYSTGASSTFTSKIKILSLAIVDCN